MPEFENLEFATNDGVALIRLSRPDQGNALNRELAQELSAVARMCREDRSVRVVMLTGAGAMFCVGGDLRTFSAVGDDVSNLVSEVAEHLHDAVLNFRRMAALLVIAVNGTAAGAGFSLSMAGDLVFAGRSAKFTMAYTAAGLSPDGGASYFLPRLVGMRRAQELIHTNRILTSSEAKDWGLLTNVIDDAQLEATALAAARQLAVGSVSAQSASKSLLSRSQTDELEAHLMLEAQGVALLAGLPDGREGVAAFLGKRSPIFL